MVLSFASPQLGTTDDGFDSIAGSTSVTSFLCALVLYSFLTQALVRLAVGEEICCLYVLKLWWWKKRVVMNYICPKRKERYLRCMRRCERRRQQRHGGKDSASNDGNDDNTDVTCPFSRAARFYKLHLPAPLPLCGKRERRGSSSSSSSVASLGESPSFSSRSNDSSRCCASNDGDACQTRTTADLPRDDSKASMEVLPCKECKRTSSEATAATASSSSSSLASVPRSLVVASSSSARYETSLIDLARMQQWSAILNRGVARREAKYRDVDGLCALHRRSRSSK
jgi:hypothetical protein